LRNFLILGKTKFCTYTIIFLSCFLLEVVLFSHNFGFENACLAIRMSPGHRFHIPQGPCAQSALKKQEQNYTSAFKSRFMNGQKCIQPLFGQYNFFKYDEKKKSKKIDPSHLPMCSTKSFSVESKAFLHSVRVKVSFYTA
jgi:hypothetical protein